MIDGGIVCSIIKGQQQSVRPQDSHLNARAALQRVRDSMCAPVIRACGHFIQRNLLAACQLKDI